MNLYVAIYDLVNTPRHKWFIEAENDQEATAIIGKGIKDLLDQANGRVVGNMKIYKVGEQLAVSDEGTEESSANHQSIN